ncbi:beta strand repeat-containing protein [Octadecabacter temperatus]|uniref:beta strand repeat-containing protein n=1 Tax=Octadecabacter temperatus TaxID=1458307 RepID=UPI00130E64AE|nr:VCBS domain-containing protein [Octadecabacter temperatus]
MSSFTTFDTSELYTWSEITSYVDLDGFLVGQTTTFDDGRVRTTTINDGVVTNAEIIDPLNVAPWTTITTLYSDTTGLKTSQTLIMDDGRSITTSYADGVNATRTVSDVDNEYTWASKAQTFDSAGRLASVTFTYDNGRTAETDYVNGLRSQRTVTDLGDTANWATKVYTWDVMTGELLTITTTYDDSTVVVSGPKLGPLGQTITAFDTADIYTWDSRTSLYDATGVLDQRTFEYDDGRIKVTDFTDGVRSQINWTDADDVMAWSTHQLDYGVNGQLNSREVIYDDGRELTATYIDGVLASTTIDDVSNAYSWDTQVSTFDANGLIATKVVTRDDGITIESNYTDGVVQSRLLTDVLNAAVWNTIEKVYDTVSGALIYVETTLDDGTQTFEDVRGLEIVTGGTTDDVTEDEAATLVAAGTIDLVDDYRGATDFVTQTSVAGDNGLGLFTLLADGTWTYSATNNQVAIQSLEAGETLTDSFTAITTDGVETEVTVTIDGRTDSAPVYVGEAQIFLGVDNDHNGLHTFYFDILSLFTNDNNPFFLADASFSLDVGYIYGGTVGIWAAGDYDVTVVMQNNDLSASTTHVISFVVSLNYNYGDYYSRHIDLTDPLPGSSHADHLQYGVYAENVSLELFGGDDTVIFGHQAGAGYPDPGLIEVDAGAGSDTITFGSLGYYANILVDGGDGDDILAFDHLNYFDREVSGGYSVASIAGGDGDDILTFALGFGADSGTTDISGGNGNDIITFDNSISDWGIPTAAGATDFDVDGGAGDDTITFGDEVAYFAHDFDVYGGSGDDVISFGDNTGLSATEFEVDGGSGNNTITFGDVTYSNATSDIEIVTGDGNDTIVVGDAVIDSVVQFTIATGDGTNSVTIGDNYDALSITGGSGVDTISIGATSGTVPTLVSGGLGADVIQFGTGAGVLSIDLGDDTDVDTLTFGGTVRDATITNWDQGEDTINFAAQPGVIWTVSDNGGDRVFVSADGTQSFTVVGAAGVAGGDIVSGLEINQAPTFEGATTTLPNGVVGTGGAAYSQDLNALFADANSASGDSLTLSSSNLPTGFSLVGGVLSATNALTTAGDHTITILATDSLGATVSQNLSVSVAINNNYGDVSAPFYGGLYLTGTSLGDTMMFDQVEVEEGGFWSLISGAGADVISIASFDVDFYETGVSIDVGMGADAITLGSGIADLTVDLGADSESDALIFLGATGANTVINNWVNGDDTITFAGQTGNIWTVADVSGDAVFSTNGQSFTVTGAAGVAAADLVSGLEMNVAPTFTGATTILDSAAVGSLAPVSVYSQDLNTLFGDANAASGDTFTISATGLFSNFTLTNGVLTLTNPASPSAVGDHTIAVTATDLFGASVTQDVTVAVAHHHDYTNAGVPTYVSGSSLADTFTFGDNAGAINGTVAVLGGAGDDIITFGNDAGFDNGDVDVRGSSGNDTVTFGDNAGSDGGSIDIRTGSGVDTIIIGDNAAQNGGLVLIEAGLGDDAITFGSVAGSVVIYAGEGADTITFDGNVTGGSNSGVALGNPSGNLSLPYGDLAADTLIFNGTVEDFVIFNFESGLDTVDVLNEGAWFIASDDGTNTMLSDGVSDLTFMNITGLTDVADFLI